MVLRKDDLWSEDAFQDFLLEAAAVNPFVALYVAVEKGRPDIFLRFSPPAGATSDVSGTGTRESQSDFVAK